MAFLGELDVGYERRNGIGDEFLSRGLRRKNGEQFSDRGRLLRAGNEMFSFGMLSTIYLTGC